MSTQRRLTSLEADLAAAERRELEKKNGAKYHKVCPSPLVLLVHKNRC